ncbi:uncharacterized protein LOC108682085 [Hyalella azteca]|uniref:Uncharacterized protein LOC108682085 n=1 Tax=Hyalella azteca TaxID=294128 RepID=A0A979FMB4_HYAAZ|nr:uncharacterized protein LOC108682085 [Hyalella azteca]
MFASTTLCRSVSGSLASTTLCRPVSGMFASNTLCRPVSGSLASTTLRRPVSGDVCLYHIVPAGKPESPSNCTVARGMRTTLRIVCTAGEDGGSEAAFHLRASTGLPNSPVVNLTAASPEFLVSRLRKPESPSNCTVARGMRTTLRIVCMAGEDGGSEAAFHLRASTGLLARVPVGPSEAEVHNPGQAGSVSNTGSSTGSLLPPSSDSEVSSKQKLSERRFHALLPVALGVGVGLLIVVIILIVLITIRVRTHGVRGDQLNLDGDDNSGRLVCSSPRLPSLESTLGTCGTNQHCDELQSQHTGSCSDRDIQVEPESEMDPDLIPLKQGVCSSGWDSSSLQLLGPSSKPGLSAGPAGPNHQPECRAATLLPPDRYAYSCTTNINRSMQQASDIGHLHRHQHQQHQLHQQQHQSQNQQHQYQQLHQQQRPPMPSESNAPITLTGIRNQQPPLRQSSCDNRLFRGHITDANYQKSSTAAPTSHLIPSSTSSSPIPSPQCAQHSPGIGPALQNDLYCSSTLPRPGSSQAGKFQQQTYRSPINSAMNKPQHYCHHQAGQKQQITSEQTCESFDFQRGRNEPEISQRINARHQASRYNDWRGGQQSQSQLQMRLSQQDLLHNLPDPPPPFREDYMCQSSSHEEASPVANSCHHRKTDNKESSV